ncbi:hypothetical protein O6H91_03G098500 [Diphasiastrum complanatum]|uniref:Uncharacterized protein n=1 Tax=Diphasiastrum complanatum TaxID=34168 RepID=A0ACC2E9A0_DIPCM|nr:hypothetical protein O6H91_03G098500 [Diphasiastrum complanatum]
MAGVPSAAMAVRPSGNGTVSLNELDRRVSATGDAGAKSKAEMDAAASNLKEVKKDEGGEDSAPEIDSVNVLPHWEAKPCVHITGLSGMVSEEELLSLLTPHGSVSSIVFENEINDSAIVRFEHSPIGTDNVVTRVTEALNNFQYNTMTLAVEPYRSDSLLFIGNLTPEIDDAQLRSMFEPHGTVERAFVLRNSKGQTKGYGFVEYSLKSQASVAKIALGNINMDGRVLRVEWSDCRKVADMFSTVLFIDRIPKDFPNQMEATLRKMFGKYGKVKDCHLVVGVNQQLRGFGFIDYYHSKYADKAHQALDGYELDGYSIRVSFANPSKSVQSYKSRFDSSVLQGGAGFGGRGAFAALRGHMGFPLFGPRFIGSGHPGMLGMGFNMFGRGPGLVGQGFASQLLPGSASAGSIGHTPFAQGSVSQTSGSLPFASPVVSQQTTSPVSSTLQTGENYLAQQSHETAVASQYKQSDSYYGYEQPYQTAAHDSQQSSESQYQYYQSGQQYSQPQTQYQHQDAYYQQQASSQFANSAQSQYTYGQQYGQEQSQQQLYGQTTYAQQYQQTSQYPTQSYGEQNYVNHHSQPQSLSQDQNPQITALNSSSGSASYETVSQAQDVSQSQAYATTYQQGVTSQLAATSAHSATTTGSSQQSLEAQWAAYYAAQAASQQVQVGTADVGQKRTADQMDSGSQSTYNYQQQASATDYNYQQQVSASYNYQQQQASTPTFNYLQQPSGISGYQQQSSSEINTPQQPISSLLGYQPPTAANSGYQQHSFSASTPVYQQQATGSAAGGYVEAHAAQQVPVGVSSGYQLPAAAGAPSSFQQPMQQSSGSYYDYSKRPRF